MYDPLETSISYDELKKLFTEIEKSKVVAGLVGGWATYFYVNDDYSRAFGRDYMESRDIDIFFSPVFENEMEQIIKKLGFEKNGFKFRHEKIYDREAKEFVTSQESKKRPLFNLIQIFLDLFSNAETKKLETWWDLDALKKVKVMTVSGMKLVDFDTLIALKCTALFARDKADKENKDACDLYALLFHGNREYIKTLLLKRAIEKLLSRSDLIYAISEHVLRDPSKQNIVIANLQKALSNFS
jgi:hypothetical protein